jgi:hypothetical protein
MYMRIAWRGQQKEAGGKERILRGKEDGSTLHIYI